MVEESNRKKWAEDDEDEWEESVESKPPVSASKTEDRPDYRKDRYARLDNEKPPYYFDIKNLAYAVDSEDKLRPHIIGSFPADQLRIRPFEECPRGEAQVQTDSLELAKFLMDLDEEEVEGRPIRVRIHQYNRGGGSGRRGRRGDRGGRRGDRNDRGGRRGGNPPPAEVPAEEKTPKERPKFVNTKKATQETKPGSADDLAKGSPFGEAKPIDTQAREKEFEERKKVPDAVPEPVPVAVPQEPPQKDPDWDFSEESEPKPVVEEVKTRGSPRGKRYQRARGAVEGEQRQKEPQHSEEQKEPQKPRPRAWMSDAEDRNILSKPPIPVVAEPPAPRQSSNRGGRKPPRQ